jgi:hypothetical protein
VKNALKKSSPSSKVSKINLANYKPLSGARGAGVIKKSVGPNPGSITMAGGGGGLNLNNLAVSSSAINLIPNSTSWKTHRGSQPLEVSGKRPRNAANGNPPIQALSNASSFLQKSNSKPQGSSFYKNMGNNAVSSPRALPKPPQFSMASSNKREVKKKAGQSPLAAGGAELGPIGVKLSTKKKSLNNTQ